MTKPTITHDDVVRLRKALNHDISVLLHRFEEACAGFYRVDRIDVQHIEGERYTDRAKTRRERFSVVAAHAYTIYSGPLG